jgi:uroporphyrinogen decarboxylase
VGLDWCLTSAEARSRINPSKAACQGNLDPCALYSSKDQIRSLVAEMLRGFGSTKSLIANLGHGMHPDHDPEHAGAFIDAVHEVSARMVREQAGTLPK